MRFDPAADPWGAAMLAAAGLWLLSLLVVAAARLGRSSRRTGGALMIASLLAFIGAAVGGTWANIRQADELAATARSGGQVTADEGSAAASDDAGGVGEAGTGATAGEATAGDPSSGEATAGEAAADDAGSGEATAGEVAADDAGSGEATAGDEATDDAGSEPSTTDDATAGEPEPTEGAEPTGDAAEAGRAGAVAASEASARPEEPVVPEALPKVEPLPTEPRARAVEIRDILDDAARAAGGGERCGNLERVAQAWARLRMIPVTRKAESIAKDLERCRRRLLYSVSQRRLAELIEARDAWVEALPTTFRKQHDLGVQASVSGMHHERLRLGNRELDAERADALMDAGLRDELVRLQFARVVISNGKTSKTYELPVTPVGELGLPWLRAVGLGEPLRLGEE